MREATRVADYIGKQYGKLTVIDKDCDMSLKYKRTYFLCQCSCGNIKSASMANLKSKRVTSCGCALKEILKERSITHNKSNDRIYKILSGMKYRCYTPSSPKYEVYGGRGIAICSEWLDKKQGFLNFYNWAIESGYEEELTIERIDVNGNYSPDNCTWVTMGFQAKNKRDSVKVEYDGVSYLLIDLLRNMGREDEYLKIKHAIMKNNLDISTALDLPDGKYKKSIYFFKKYLIERLNSLEYGVEISKVELREGAGIVKTTLRKYLKDPEIKDILNKFNVKVFDRYLIKENKVGGK